MGELELPPETLMTVDEFIDWCKARRDDTRYELVDGRPVAMGLDSRQHNRCKKRTIAAFDAAIGAAGLPCEAFVDGIGVSRATRSFRIPDIVVDCGDTGDDQAYLAARPVIVVEILSRSTEKRDVHTKLNEYFDIESVQHYLIVSPDDRYVLHHRRDERVGIATAMVRDGEITLDPPGLTLSVCEFFEEAA